MNFFKLLMVIALAGAGYKYWSDKNQIVQIAAVTSPRGFVQLPALDNAPRNTILVFAAENCPHEDAARADALAAQLSRNGLPVARRQHASFPSVGSEAGALERINAVMTGKLPIVFVNGAAKANPTQEEVIAEYRAAAR
jgi:hypothetical protein